jgi:hypothetical protein
MPYRNESEVMLYVRRSPLRVHREWVMTRSKRTW